MLRRLLPSAAAMPYVLLVFAALCWAGNFILARAMHADIPPVTLAFGRWLVAMLVLLPIAWPRIRAQKARLLKSWKRLLWLAGYGIAVSNTLIYIGLHHTHATNAVLFNALIPLMVMLLSWMVWRKPLAGREWTGMGASLLGVLLIVCHGDIARLFGLELNGGDALVVAGLASWSAYTVLLRGLPDGLDRFAVLWLTIALGLLMLLPFFAWEVAHVGLPAVNQDNLLSILYLGIFPSVIALTAYMRAVASLGPTRAAGFLHLIPAFGAVGAGIFLNEQLALYHVLGLAIIFAGLYWAQGQSQAQPGATVAQKPLSR
ncbi:DMT family transporter [Chitinimonas arctica]|uniref:DMT family transporter n=1 Tax=Chitinimonas arctica TaxID=2594795 RepID=A0A516SGR9_9NEIS|nr:DMT family transporter [Chitinimonas arctica]QDQ27361.1 DMT family transporter [Chitinimonas arctica]